MSQDDGGHDSDLPPMLALLWGRRRERGSGTSSRPGLSLDRIVAAAVELADAEGLAAVSMSRVAESLGFTTMSLYRHVASKDDLLALMLDAAEADPPRLPDTDDWRARLEAWAWANFHGCLRHPWILQVPLDGPQLGPNRLLWLDRGLQAVETTPLAEEEKLRAVLLVTVYVVGQAKLAVDAAQAAQDPTPGPSFAQLIAGLIDAENYPALSRALASGSLDGPDDRSPSGYDDEFRSSLAQLLDGIEVRVRAHREAG